MDCILCRKKHASHICLFTSDGLKQHLHVLFYSEVLCRKLLAVEEVLRVYRRPLSQSNSLSFLYSAESILQFSAGVSGEEL